MENKVTVETMDEFPNAIRIIVPSVDVGGKMYEFARQLGCCRINAPRALWLEVDPTAERLEQVQREIHTFTERVNRICPINEWVHLHLLGTRLCTHTEIDPDWGGPQNNIIKVTGSGPYWTKLLIKFSKKFGYPFVDSRTTTMFRLEVPPLPETAERVRQAISEYAGQIQADGDL